MFDEFKRDSKEDKQELSLHRIEGLFDAVLAIAMTLLVLDIAIPDTSDVVDSSSLFSELWRMGDTFLKYFISFFILAGFWVANNAEFKHLKRADKTFLWLNLLSIFFISLIPFSTSLMDTYSEILLAEVVFHFNIFVVELFIFWRSFYIYKHQNLVDFNITDDKQLYRYCIGSLGGLLIPLVAVGLAFFIQGNSSYVYFLLPFSKKLMKRKTKSSSSVI